MSASQPLKRDCIGRTATTLVELRTRRHGASSDTIVPKGSLVEIEGTWRGRFHIRTIEKYGEPVSIRRVESRDLAMVWTAEEELASTSNRKPRIRCKDLVGQYVRAARDIVNMRGEKIPAGASCIIDRTYRGAFTLSYAKGRGCVTISQVERSSFVLVEVAK